METKINFPSIYSWQTTKVWSETIYAVWAQWLCLKFFHLLWEVGPDFRIWTCWNSGVEADREAYRLWPCPLCWQLLYQCPFSRRTLKKKNVTLRKNRKHLPKRSALFGLYNIFWSALFGLYSTHSYKAKADKKVHSLWPKWKTERVLLLLRNLQFETGTMCGPMFQNFPQPIARRNKWQLNFPPIYHFMKTNELFN